jgi:integrase
LTRRWRAAAKRAQVSSRSSGVVLSHRARAAAFAAARRRFGLPGVARRGCAVGGGRRGDDRRRLLLHHRRDLSVELLRVESGRPPRPLPSHPISRELYRDELKPLLTVPRGQRAVKAFTADQAAHFLAVAREHSRLAECYSVGFLSGLRLGELLGLQLDDDQVDHGHRTLAISRTLLGGSTTTPVCGPPKNGRTRHVDVGHDLGRVLDRLASQRPRLALKHAWRRIPNWAFVTETGHPFDQSYVRRDFERVLTLAGFQHLELTPHGMRHTFACLHIAAGCNPKWLQQQPGHASIQITLDVYGDHFALKDRQAADALGSTLLGNGSGNGGRF